MVSLAKALDMSVDEPAELLLLLIIDQDWPDKSFQVTKIKLLQPSGFLVQGYLGRRILLCKLTN